MNRRRIFAALLLLLIPLSSVPAQIERLKNEKSLAQFSHDVWNTDDGLPQNSINKMVQTPDGYIWLGTQEGLVRFDGVQFTIFDKHNTPSIKNNYISALFVDRKGTLWIGTYDGGLITYANKRFRGIGGMPKLENSHIRSIYQDKKDGMWIAIRGRGVMRIDSVSHQSFDTTNGLVYNEAWNFFEDSKGTMWISTEQGISLYSNGTFRSFTMKEGLLYSVVSAVIEGLDNTMYIATNRGVQRVPLDPFSSQQRKTTYGKKEGLPDDIVYDLVLDHEGALWMATREGVARLFKNEISPFTVDNGLSYNHISSLLVDFENNIWIGTDGGGLNVLKNGLFTSFGKREGVPSDVIWTIYEDRTHAMWIGTDNGLVKITGDGKNSRKYFTTKEGLYDNEVYSFAEDHSGAMWVATVNGLQKIVNDAVVPLNLPIKTKGLIITHVFEDSRKRMWIATSGDGLHKLENGKIVTYNSANGFISNYINCLAEDRNGNIIAGSDGEGIAFISDTGMFRKVGKKEGLASTFVHAIYVDSSNIVWAGTFGGGLHHIDGDSAVSITVREGLYDDLIFQILEDRFGRLWMTSNKGIFTVTKEQLKDFVGGKISTITSVTYGKEDGLRSNEMNGGVQPAGWKAHDGTLWFPTTGGVAMVDPSEIKLNQQPPRVIVEEMLVDNLMFRDPVIPPGKERYEFRFTGISFAGPKKIRFKVMLEGYDKQWDDIGTRRAAYYTHIPPGEYTFHVIAANSDGVWNDVGSTMPFVVQAHFYETKAFFLSLGVALLLLVFGAYRWRIRQIINRERELERLVEERTKNLVEANNAKSQLLGFVAHDLKTPLITINSIAQEIKSFDNIDRHFRGYLDLVEQNSKRIVTLISEILNITAIESGKIEFKLEPINMAEIGAVVVDGYQIQAQRKDQTLTYRVEADEQCVVMADSVKMQEAMENLVNNAIKYSPRGAKIAVTVARQNGIVRFAVNDQGPGISAEDKLRLFQKFQVLSAKPTGGEIATGLGLAIVKEIIEAHHGTIYVESEPPKGSTFIIELPRVESTEQH